MILYGGGGHAKVVRDCIIASGQKLSFIFDDNTDIVKLDETQVAGLYNPEKNKTEELVISVGDNLIRKKIAEKVKHPFGKVAHPSAIISPSAKIGEGSVIFHGSIVQAGATIGKHCIINSSALVEHDNSIGDYVHISPNVTLCSNVHIGEGTHIGAAAVILPNKKIGKWCVIGAGSVITTDVPDFSMVVGVPGKIIKTVVKKS